MASTDTLIAPPVVVPQVVVPQPHIAPKSGPPRTRLSRRLIDPQNPSYKWWVAATVTLGGFLVNMSLTAVQVAFPEIMTAFGLSLTQAQWIVMAYVIAGAICVPAIGWLGSRLGNRTLYLLSLLVFLAGSILCSLAWSGPSLTCFRVLQGIGGGPIPPMTMMFLSNTFSEREKGLAMGIYGLGSTFGPVVGPVMGGYVTDVLNWRMVFLVNIVPGLVCLGLAVLTLPNLRDTKTPPLDWLGLLTLSLFLVSLLVALSQGYRHGWTSPFIQRLLIIAVVSLVTFIGVELLVRHPLIDLRLYTHVTFSAACLIILIFFMSFAGSNFLQILLVQRLFDYPVTQAGFVFLPGALVLSLGFPIAGRIADKVDRRAMIFCALGVFALSSYLFSFLSLDRPLRWMIWLVVLRYSCGGFVFAPLMSMALSQLPPEKIRMGSGLLNLMQIGLGATLGISVATTVLQSRTAYHREVLNQNQAFSQLPWGEIWLPIQQFLHQLGSLGQEGKAQGMMLLHRYLMQQATVAAYRDYFMVIAVLSVATIPLIWLVKDPKRSKS